MKIYQHKTSQKLNISKNNAWDFFSNLSNLSKITPTWLKFEVKTKLPGKMYAGMIISYFVRPLLNIPQIWVTEITHVNEPNYFVVEQRFGPFKMWHHEHIFKSTETGGVMMEDIVSDDVPFGFLGRIMNRLVIEKKHMRFLTTEEMF